MRLHKASKFVVILVLALFLSGIGYAQGNISCTDTVSDSQHILGDAADVQVAATTLVNQGADVHFITTTASGATLEQKLTLMKNVCPSWKSPNGGVKANMLVFMVAPKERKMAIFYGPGYAAALEGQTDRIKRDFMGPRFRGGDWNGGLVAGANQVARRIKASLDESNKPVTHETVNQATDLHGLWVFLWILGGLASFGLLFWLIYAIKKHKEAIQTAQQNAISARTRMVNLFQDVNDAVKAYSDNTSIRPSNISRAASILDTVSAEVTRLGNSLSADPTSEGMGLGFYRSLESTYVALTNRLLQAKDYINGAVDPEPPATSSSVNWADAPAPTESSSSPSSSPTPAPAPASQTVVVNDSGSGDLATGILIGEAMGGDREREPEPEPSHSSSDGDFGDSGSSSSSDSGDFGGSSSSWSDSGSSWSDSGSSDFGGGGDSGGGFGGDSSSF